MPLCLYYLVRKSSNMSSYVYIVVNIRNKGLLILCPYFNSCKYNLHLEMLCIMTVIITIIVQETAVLVQCDSFGTRPKKMRISQRLFIRFWTCIYDYIPCFMKSVSILEDMLEMFATTVQAELNATLHVCESGLQDVLTNRINFTSNVVFQFLYGAWLVGISFSL